MRKRNLPKIIFCSLVCLRLKPVLLERAFHELDLNFRYEIKVLPNFYCNYYIISSSYWRPLISIACNLHRTRELRDLFVDLCEKLIEPWRQNSWSRDHVNKFLAAITQSVLDLEISR